MALVLTLVYLLALFFQPQYFYLPIIAVLSSVVSELVLLDLFGRKLYPPYSALVTGLLVGLNLNPESGFLLFILLPSLAILGKNLMEKFFKIHLFNPAASALFLGSFLFIEKTAWWAASSNLFSPIIIVLGAGWVLHRMGRLSLPLSFLAVYYSFSLILNPSLLTHLDLLILDPTVLLFALVMLPEPQTSPARGVWKWTWGLLVGLIFIIYSTITPFKIFDPLIVSLLLADLVNVRKFLQSI